MSPKKRERYSLTKIAEELNVGKATVSAVLNGRSRKSGISRKLEKRIVDFCDEVNYSPNIHARRINSRQVKNIGILVKHVGGLYHKSLLGEYNTSNVLGGVAAAAEQKGYSYSIKVLRGVQNEMEKVFDWFRCREIDGMIYYGFNMSQKHLAKLKEMRAMIVAIGTDPESGVPCVNLNSYSIFLKLTEYLIAKGYKKFVYLGGDGDVYLANMKYKGFLDTLKKYSIPFSPTKYINAGFGIDSAENIVLKMGRAVKEDTDAIICANDNMAVGTIRALLQMGLKVPLDIAVTGGDNIMLGRYIIPSLTTVHARAYQCGKAAFDLLYNIINNSGPRKNIKIESSLILRESA